MVVLAIIKMGLYMWMKVINSENPPMKPIDHRFSDDIYWALASALETSVNFVILPKIEMVMDIQHGMHLLEILSQKLNKMRMENKTI